MRRVFINGFGRIGRSAARIILEDKRFTLVGINDLYSFKQMAYLLQYDSIYGNFPHVVSVDKDCMYVDDKTIALFSQRDPAKLDLSALDVDVLLECSGMFLTEDNNQPFLDNGVKKVLISTPPKETMPTYIMGVNHHAYQGERILSNSSCSANAIVPIFQIIDGLYGIQSAMLSMYHSYTGYQRLLDTKHYSKDIRRSRSATKNIIPLQSSAAKATAYFFPHLKDKLYAKSIRIPLKATTYYDLSLKIDKETTISVLHEYLHRQIVSSYKGILDIATEPKVSSDYIANSHSAVIELASCMVMQNNLLKISAWQDNEYGYAKRLVDMAAVVS